MSSSMPNSQTIPHSRRQAKGSHKSKRSRRQPPFRFRDLPPEIRNKIYRLCLVDDVEIRIQEEDTAGYDEGGYYDRSEYEEIGLEVNYSWYRHQGIHMAFDLLFVDKAAHQEAATILYGFNTFKLGTSAFQIFTYQLPRRNLDCLRRLDLEFPLMDRYVDGRSVQIRKPLPLAKTDMIVLKSLPKLENLQFRVTHDIMSSDCDRIRWMAGMLVKSKVVLHFGIASTWDEYRSRNGLVRISAAARKLCCDCGWELRGDHVKIDAPHKFTNEVLWLENLQGADLDEDMSDGSDWSG